MCIRDRDYAVIRKGARLRRTIVDRYNEIAPNTRVGFDAAADRQRYVVSEGGVVVLGKRQYVPDVTRYAT